LRGVARRRDNGIAAAVTRNRSRGSASDIINIAYHQHAGAPWQHDAWRVAQRAWHGARRVAALAAAQTWWRALAPPGAGPCLRPGRSNLIDVAIKQRDSWLWHDSGVAGMATAACYMACCGWRRLAAFMADSSACMTWRRRLWR